jgi:ADP-ribose pyrophosphatase YjhB (NUDIX family)
VSEPWLAWARRLAALAQSGNAYATDPFDRERYDEILLIAAGMVARLGQVPPAAVADLYLPQAGYATPKIDLRAAVVDGERLLMVRERSDGGWALPGGWGDVNESAREGIEREVREEAGLDVLVTGLVGVYDRDRWGHPPMPFSIYKVVLRCEAVGGVLAAGSETSDAAFFAEAEVPRLSATRLSRELLARVFAHVRDPGLPADVD